MNLILCADKVCPKKKECYRYTADPTAVMLTNKRIRIESTLRLQGFEECKKFIQIKESSYEAHL